jgi:hypothetical protein
LSPTLAVLTACAGAPEPAPLTPPPLETGVRYLSGTVLSGREPDPEAGAELPTDEALEIRCEVTFTEHMPWTALDPAASRTRLIVAAHGADPLLPAADLGTDARFGTGEDAAAFLAAVAEDGLAGRSVPLLGFRAVLLPGVTTGFHARAVEPQQTGTGAYVRKLVALLVSREAGARTASVAMLFEDLDPLRRPLADEADPLEDTPVHKRELIILEDELEVDGPAFAIVIPSTFDADATRAFVVQLRLGEADPSDAMLQDALAQCADDLRREGERAARDAAFAGALEQRAQSVRSGLRALELARDQRPLLVFLAAQDETAPLALDLALSGDEASLAGWAELVGVAEDGAGALATAAASSWHLERSAFALLASRLDRDELAIGLRGMLAQHAGEAGRFPGTLSGLLARATDRESFLQMLIDENLGFLDAPDPAARVRAFDWLRKHGAAPPAYDPLAERGERDAALDAWRASRDAAATTASGAEVGR